MLTYIFIEYKLEKLFMHIENYFEYILNDSSYEDRNQYVGRKLWHEKQNLFDKNDLVNVYNKMHANFRIRRECLFLFFNQIDLILVINKLNIINMKSVR